MGCQAFVLDGKGELEIDGMTVGDKIFNYFNGNRGENPVEFVVGRGNTVRGDTVVLTLLKGGNGRPFIRRVIYSGSWESREVISTAMEGEQKYVKENRIMGKMGGNHLK
jgi:hypothetical protein